MRPVTFRKLLFQCLFLVVILFLVVVIALKFGAVPVSLYAWPRFASRTPRPEQPNFQ